MALTDGRRRSRLAAAALGLLAALAAAELVLRLTHFGVYAERVANYNFLHRDGEAFWFADPERPPEIRWDGDPYGTLPPGARMTYPVNSKGLRGPEPDAERDKVLLVGDSFTFGEGVRWDDAFAARLERAFGAGETSPQFIAAALPGYGTEQEAARLPGWLDEFDPKAAVVVFVPNDPISLDDTVDRDDFLNRASPPPTLYLARLAGAVLGRGAADRAVEEWYESYYFGERRSAWEASRRLLAAMKPRCEIAFHPPRRNVTRLGVVLFPLLHRLKERPFAKVHEAVAAVCRENAIPFLDLTDALAAEEERRLWVHPTDHHPNARAHELAAAAMRPFIESMLR